MDMWLNVLQKSFSHGLWTYDCTSMMFLLKQVASEVAIINAIKTLRCRPWADDDKTSDGDRRKQSTVGHSGVKKSHHDARKHSRQRSGIADFRRGYITLGKKKMPGVKVTAALSSRFGCRENRNIDCVYLQGGPKNWCHFLYALTLSNIDQFSNFFTVGIRRKFTVYNNSLVSLKIPTHLKYVATLRFM